MNRRFDRLPRAAAAAACAVLLLLSQTAGYSAGAQLISGTVPKAVVRLHPLAHYDGTNRLNLAIGLPLQDGNGLSAYLQDVYNSASPRYHQYLTASQFAERFGPSVADYESLKAFARSNRLAIKQTYSNRTLLDVEGSVADIEKALHITMRVYKHPTENRTFFAPDTEPSVDCAVRILHIAGLDNYLIPHPNSGSRPISALPAGHPAFGSGPGGTYLGYDFRAAYVPQVTLDGAGQKVALLEFDAYFPNDPVEYEKEAGLPNVHLVNIPIQGFTGPPGSGNFEVSLDIEMAIAMAPGLAEILVYEATNSTVNTGNLSDDMLNAIAIDDLANQVSSSWTFPVDASTDQIFLQMAAQGQSYFNASGDSGAYPPGAVQTPTDDTNITTVGGTTLTTSGPGGEWQSEVVWSYFNQGTGSNASSGGISTTFAIPVWQQGISMVKNQGSTTFRNLPDVALTADNIFVIANNGQGNSGFGTSAAAPLWAGFTALVNEQSITKAGNPPVGFLNPAIYSIGKGSSSLYNTAFHDITSGNNTNLVSSNLFYAVTGYDLCTGWGTPAGSALINKLAPVIQAPVLVVFSNTITGGNGNGVIDFDECDNLSVILTNEGTVTATAIQGILYSTTPGVIVAQQNVTFPPLPPHTSAPSINTFTISTEPSFVCGTPIDLTLILKFDQGIETNSIELPSGILGSSEIFPNTTVITIPNNNLTGINSAITVSGLESVGKITVSTYITALYDVGLVLQLTAPNGVSVLLSGNNGGLSPNFGSGCNPAGETTFDDAATESITLASPPYVGSFQPQEPLSTFNLFSGTNLNGVWLLNVVDQISGDTAQLNCWSLNISPEMCTEGGGECPGSDLSLSMTAVPNIVLVDSNLVFNLLVSNAGPSTANNVVIAETLPPGVGFVTTSNYPVSVGQSGSILNLSLGALPVYGTALVCVVTIPTIPGLVTSVATVGSPSADPNPNNNTASATADVTLPGADLAVAMTASPSFVLQGGPLTYTISVTNNGPFLATQVTLDNTLPPNVNLISATTSQGSISGNGTVVDIGTLNPGSNALVTIVVSPTTTGNLTASTEVTLSPLEIDPNLFNNIASATVTVGPSADLAVSGYFSPPTVLSGAIYTNVATVINNGPSPATGVVFSQTIPGGVSFVSTSAAGVVVTNGIISWNVGAMSNGSSLSITNVLKAPTLLSGIQSELLSSLLTVFGQPGDAITNNNVFTVQALVEPPTITIVPVNAVLISGSSDGAVAPGESVQVELNLQNTGNVNTTNVMATLQSSGGVTLPYPSGAVSYGPLAAGAPPVGRQFSFTANGTNGGTVVATLQLTDGSANLGTVAFTFYMPVVTTFWNNSPIDIPNKAFVPEPDSGPANPYPSMLTVSNVTGFVSQVTVTVSNMSHGYPHDVAMLLVGPDGQDAAIMVDAAANALVGMVDQTLIFDQTASNALPASGQIVSGTYRPADYGPSYSFSNAPAGPYTTNLLVFSGISPNGVWSLYAYDTAQGDSGGISNGWAVTITTITPVNQEADLSASIVASTDQLTLGNSVTFLLSVTNNGPNAASAYLTNILPAGLSFVSTSASQSNYTQNGQVVLYTLGMLNPGTGETITNVLLTSGGGLETNTIVASSTLPDPNLADNSASAVVAVIMPLADVAAGITATPNPVVVTSNLLYTLVVTNLGPSNALNVTGSFSLNGLDFVAASSSQGSAIFSGGAVQCSLGTVPAGNIATVTVTAVPPAIGQLTNVWTVSTSDEDTNPANNSIASVVTVINPTPVIVAGGDALLTQGGNFSNGAINSNETVTVAFTLNNIGSAPTTNLTATLQANANLTPTTTSQNYGTIAPGASGAQSYVFTARGVPGAAVNAILVLTNGGSSFGSVSFAFLIPAITNYSQTGEIIIPEYGPGVPYPSQIQVSGLSGLVSEVTATLNGFTHTFPHDVNVLLADPAGQELFLMSHVGGAYSVTNLTLTFEDSATQSLPAGQLSSGAFLPTAVTPLNPLPGIPAAPSVSSLAVFNGTNPNGNWSLYVFDDTQGNSGDISSGWSLGLTSVNTVNPAAVLAAGMVHAPDPVFSGNFLNYLITITNLGPNNATGVILTDTLPAGAAYASTTLSQGTSSVSGGTVTCSLGTIGVGATATATISVIAEASGTIVNTATVTTASTDLYLADSTTANNATVLNPPIAFLEATNYSSGLQLTLLGQSSQTYGIQVSTDLINWTTVSTNTAAANGTFTFTDNGTNLPARFYRGIRLAQ
jgi:uncharacterized repeat protein (TIGR01451 family)